jgi:hypothetical protein
MDERSVNQSIIGSGNFSSNFSGSIGSVNGSGEDVYKLLKDKDAQINKLLEQISKLIEIISSK